MSSLYLVNKSVCYKHLLDTSKSDLYTHLPIYAGLYVESSHLTIMTSRHHRRRMTYIGGPSYIKLFSLFSNSGGPGSRGRNTRVLSNPEPGNEEQSQPTTYTLRELILRNHAAVFGDPLPNTADTLIPERSTTTSSDAQVSQGTDQ